MYNNIYIDISQLEIYLNDFSKEKKSFELNSYNTFKSSYLNHSNDPFIRQMSTKLNNLYEKLDDGYDNIYNWYKEYVKNISSLEKSLKNSSSIGSITEPSVKNYISAKIPTLKNQLNPNLIDFNSISTNPNNLINASIKSEDIFKSDTKKVENVLKKTSATVFDGCISVFEGLFELGHNLYKSARIGWDKIVGNVFYDLGLITVEQYYTGKEEIMDEVKEDFWKDYFDKDFYEDNKLGKFVKNNSYGFDTVRSGGNIIGETIGSLSLGGGITGAAVTSGVSGFGRQATTAWNDGASYDNGIQSSFVRGAFDSAQWYLGGKVSKFAAFSKTGANVASRIAMDTGLGASEGLFDPVIKSMYRKGYYDSNGNYKDFDTKSSWVSNFKSLFQESGGWKNVAINAAMAGGMSGIGEKINSFKSNVKSKNIDVSLNKNEKIKKVDDLKSEIDNEKINIDTNNSKPNNVKEEKIEIVPELKEEEIDLNKSNDFSKIIEIQRKMELDNIYKEYKDLQRKKYDINEQINNFKSDDYNSYELTRLYDKLDGIEDKLFERYLIIKENAGSNTIKADIKREYDPEIEKMEHRKDINGLSLITKTKEDLSKLEEYYDGLEKFVENNKIAKIKLDELKEKGLFISLSDECSCFRNGTIHLSDVALKTKNYNTFFHEAGHFSDWYLNEFRDVNEIINPVVKKDSILNYGTKEDGLSKFINECEEQINSLVEHYMTTGKNEIEKMLDDMNVNNLSKEEEEYLFKELLSKKISLIEDDFGYSQISDIFDAITKGKMYDELKFSGHGKEYYSNDRNISTEIIAEYTSLKVIGKDHLLKKYFSQNFIDKLEEAYNKILNAKG